MPKATKATRIANLRDRLNLTQKELAHRSGVLSPGEISHLETARNKGSSRRVREALAKAFGLPLRRLEQYLAGRVRLDEVAAEVQDVPHPDDDLEAAIRVFESERRWSRPTTAAVRAMLPAGRVTPREWIFVLDMLETEFERMRRRSVAQVGLPAATTESQQAGSQAGTGADPLVAALIAAARARSADLAPPPPPGTETVESGGSGLTSHADPK